MAQFIFWNWQDDDSTKNLNHRTLGLKDPGLYRGFDPDFNTPGGMTLRLRHSITGFDVTKFDSPSFTVEKRGVLLTKQGVVIHENDNIDIPINPNATAHGRIDLIICEHEYVDIPNSSIAIYSVIQGTPSATPVAPAIPAPDQIKVILGYLYVPAGTVALSGLNVVYVRAEVANSLYAGTDWQPLSYDIATERFYVEAKSNFYVWNGGSQTTVKHLSHAFEQMPVTSFAIIRTAARIILKSTGTAYNKFTFLNEVGPDAMVIEKGEMFMIAKTSATEWKVVSGGTALRHAANKFFKGQIFSKSTGDAAIAVDGSVNSLLTGANYFNVPVVSVNQQIKFLPTSRIAANAYPTIEAGGFVFLELSGNQSIIVNDAAAPPVGYKAISTGYLGGVNIQCKPGEMVLAIEDGTYWKIISVLGTQNNWKAVYDLISLETSLRSAADANEVAARIAADVVLQDAIDALGVINPQSISLVPGWANTGGLHGNCKATKNHLGFVQCSGHAQKAAVGSSEAIGTLPLAHRPATERTFYLPMGDTLGAADGSLNRIRDVSVTVMTTGSIYLNLAGGASDVCVSLDGISFYVQV